MKSFGKPVPGLSYVERPGAYAFLPDHSRNLAIVQTGHGFFLPGGGVESGEDLLTGLKREVFEEIGYTVTSAQALGQAAQYHWSEFYRSHFKKIGTFFLCTATAPSVPAFQADHKLLWLPAIEAARTLTQEFQRYAVAEFYLP